MSDLIPCNRFGDEIPFDLSPEVPVEEPRVVAEDAPTDDEPDDTTFNQRRTIERDFRAGIHPETLFAAITELGLWTRPDEECESWKAFLSELFDAYGLSQPRTALLSLLPYQGTPEPYTGRMEDSGYRVFGGAE